MAEAKGRNHSIYRRALTVPARQGTPKPPLLQRRLRRTQADTALLLQTMNCSRSGGSRELPALGPEFVTLHHQPDRIGRSPHHLRPGDQFELATILQRCRPTDGDIHSRPGFRRIRAAQTNSAAAHVHSLGTDWSMPFVRLQDRVPRFPPKWKPSRSSALNLVHGPIMR